jgi:hypothetical protein
VNLKPEDIDGIICATFTPDNFFSLDCLCHTGKAWLQKCLCVRCKCSLCGFCLRSYYRKWADSFRTRKERSGCGCRGNLKDS